MKLKFHIVLLAATVLFSVSCKDKKDEDKDKEGKGGSKSAGYDNLGGSKNENAQVFGNLMSNMPNTAAAFKVDLMQLVNKSGAKDDQDFGAMVAMAMMQVQGLVDIDQPIRVAVSGDNAENISVVAMIAVKDRDQLINELTSNMDGTEFEEANGFMFGSVKMGDSFRVKMGINNNFCLIHYSDKFKNKEESKAAIESLFAACAEDVEFTDNVDSYLASDEDFALMISPENMLGMMPEDQIKQAKLNADDIKDGWTNLSLDFVNGAIQMEAHNTYPNMTDMDFAGDGLPAEYASLLTNDQLIGFGGGSLNVNKLVEMANASGADFGDFEEKTGISFEEFSGMFDGTMSIALTGVPNMDNWLAERLDNNDYDEDVSDQFDDLNDEEADSKGQSFQDYDPSANAEKMEEAGEEALKNMVIAIGLNDEATVTAIIDTMKNAKKMGNYYEMISNKENKHVGYLAIKDNKLMISGDEAVIKTFSNDGALAMAAEAKPYMSTAFNGYMSFDLLKELMTTKEGAEDLMEIKFLDIFQNMVLQGDLNDMTLRVNMDNQSDNALKQIVGLLLQNAGDLMQGMQFAM